MVGLMEWRKNVGDDVANYIARTAAHRGTKVHHMCEDFLNNNFDEETHKKNFLPYVLFGQMKPVLMQKVNNILAQECGCIPINIECRRDESIVLQNTTVSNLLLISKHQEKNAMMTGMSPIIFNGSAYAEMFEERTGIEINQIVILVVTEDGVVQEFVKDKGEYIPMLVEMQLMTSLQIGKKKMKWFLVVVMTCNLMVHTPLWIPYKLLKQKKVFISCCSKQIYFVFKKRN